MWNCVAPRPVTQKPPLPVPCALFENPLMLASWPHRRALVFICPTQPGHSLRRYLLSAHWARAVLPVQEDQSKVPAVTGCMHPWTREMATQLKRYTGR